MTSRTRTGLARYIRLLLSFYPRDFRHTMGPDLETVYLDRFQAEYRHRGYWGVVRYSALALAHAIRDGLLERLPSAHRGRRPNRRIAGGRWLADARYALRGLVKRPAFLIISVVTLGLGIGASTTIFSVVNAVLLRPLPYPNSHELVAIGFRVPGFDRLGSVAWRVAQAFDQRSETLASLATVRGYEADIAPDADYPEAERLWAASVSSGFFSVLGTRPMLGRAFVSEEDVSPTARVIILSHQAWRDRWGADSTIVGESVVVNNEPHQVVGVMPPDFTPPEGLGLARVDVLFPALAAVADRRYDNYQRGYFQVVGRLGPDVSAQESQTELATIHAALGQEVEAVQEGAVEVLQLRTLTEAGSGRTLWPLFGAVTMLLIIGSVNVINLFLARATSRRRELAVRIALGASRGDIIRQLLIESVSVALAGGALGLLLAGAGVEAIAAWGNPGDLPRLAEVNLDARVLMFAMGVALLTGALIGLVPALRSGTIQQEILREAAGQATASRSTHRFRSGLVVAQTAIALVLLVGAGLMINSFVRLTSVDPGFEPDGVLVAHMLIPRSQFSGQQAGIALRRQVLERVRALPGVHSAASTLTLPIDGFPGKGSMRFTLEAASDEEVEVGALSWVGPGYFATIGIALQPGGRSFTEDDVTRDDVLMVNRSFERAYWPDGSIVGQRIKMGPAEAETTWNTIIGVVDDVRGASLATRQAPAIYFPDASMIIGPPLIIVIKTEGDPLALAPAVRSIIGEVAPSIPIGRLETLQQHVARSVTAPRFYTSLLGGFAAAGLLLAVVGIYGTLSYMVGQRTREMGVRLALGATPSQVLHLVVRHGLTLGLLGILLGGGGAIIASRSLSGFLYEVTPLDPWTYAVVALTLAAAALVATLAPALRATRIDPVAALKAE